MKSIRTSKQAGVVLPVTLVMLAILTILGLAAIGSGISEEKISVNQQDKNRSFEASETALKSAEAWLSSLTSAPIPVDTECQTLPCVMQTDGARYPERQADDWWQDQGTVSDTELVDVADSPRYVIEFNRFVPDDASVGLGYNQQGTYFYRITSAGIGNSATARTYLQINVGRRY